ncbi:MAG: HEPN domain-containing protein [Cyanobacteria bacterium]|nr:HEPN domain-containing protein [Cyanobacteriota bacterium]
MTNRSLAKSYLLKARTRLLVLELLLREEAYSDVVREAQELVELALKGLLRHAAVEPPKWHDVGGTVREFHERFHSISSDALERLTAASYWLRKEREAAL